MLGQKGFYRHGTRGDLRLNANIPNNPNHFILSLSNPAASGIPNVDSISPGDEILLTTRKRSEPGRLHDRRTFMEMKQSYEFWSHFHLVVQVVLDLTDIEFGWATVPIWGRSTFRTFTARHWGLTGW